MKEFKSIKGIKDNILKLTIEDEVELYLTSPSNSYVIFDGTASVLFEGSLSECFVYRETFKKYNDYDVTIYSREAYDKMMGMICEAYGSNKTYKSFWDYTATLNKDSDKYRDAMNIGAKYSNAGKDPNEYLEEIIDEVNKRNK